MNLAKYVSVERLSSQVLIRGIDEDGNDFHHKLKYKPVLFRPARSNDPSSFVSMVGETPLTKLNFDSIWDAKEYIDEMTAASPGLVFGQGRWDHQAIAHHNLLRGKAVAKRSEVRIHYLDIEVLSNNGFPDPMLAEAKVTRVCIYDSKDDKFFLIAPADGWDPSQSKLPQDVIDRVVHIVANNETEIFRELYEFWVNRCPHILTGWNVNRFDLSYLFNRAERLSQPLSSLSPFGQVKVKGARDQWGNDHNEVEAVGVSIIDMLEVQKKFNRKQYPFNTLECVSQGELKRGKLYWENEQGQPMNLREMEANPLAYSDYVIDDVCLVLDIDLKRKFLDLVLTISDIARVSPVDVFSPIPCWDSLIYNFLLQNNTVPEIRRHDGGKGIKFEGAWVKPPHCEKHSWILSYDLTSLYPSIMMQWNMCPSTLAEGHSLEYDDYGPDILKNSESSKITHHSRDTDYCYSANGTAFVKSDIQMGWLPTVIKMVFDQRQTAKKKMLDARNEVQRAKERGDEATEQEQESLAAAYYVRQDSLKVLLNSLYGACGNRFFRYFDLRIAEGITRTGRLVVQWIERDVNEYINRISGTDGVDYCVGIDTDSNYFKIEGLVRILIDKFGQPESEQKLIDMVDIAAKGIQDNIIEPSCVRLQKITNCSENFMIMKREAIATAGFWTAKKRYALRVVDSEGVRYSEPEIEMKGLEIVKRDTPKIAQDMLTEAVEILLDPEDKTAQVPKFVDACWERYKEAHIDDIAEFTSVSRVDRNVSHINAQAASLFNDLVEKHGLERDVRLIKNGDKIKLLNLKSPNPWDNATAIAYTEHVPDVFQVDKYVDRRAMFEKKFLAPAKRMCDVCDVETTAQEKVDDWFD